MTALERLSKINSERTFQNWYYETDGYNSLISDIEEVVALAKANQQPSIDAMRFEAAKDVLKTLLSDTTIRDTIENFASKSVKIADALIAELQKPKQ